MIKKIGQLRDDPRCSTWDHRWNSKRLFPGIGKKGARGRTGRELMTVTPGDRLGIRPVERRGRKGAISMEQGRGGKKYREEKTWLKLRNSEKK